MRLRVSVQHNTVPVTGMDVAVLNTAGVAIADLHDYDASAQSGISLDVVTPFAASASRPALVDQDWHGFDGAAWVASNYSRSEDSDPAALVRVSGAALTPGQSYTVKLAGLWDSAYTVTYTVNGNSADYVGPNGTNPQTVPAPVEIVAVATDDGSGNGVIDITSDYGAGSGRNHLSLFEVTDAVATPTTRKGSTFDIETTLSGTVTTATLNAVDVSDHITGQTGTTVSFDGGLTAEITTSGQYDLVLTDDSADPDETITVQVNVVGLPSNTARKDGALLASLTDLTLDALNSSGTLVKQLTGITTDASGVISPVDLSDLSEAVGDTLKVSLHSAASDVGVTFEQALELI